MLDVEVGFISKLLQTKDIMTVKDSQIKLTHFTGDNKVAYQYIYDTFMKTGEVPTVRAFKRKFPHYPLEMYRGEVGTEENLLYWCQELRVKTKHNELADLVDVVASKLQDFHTEEAYSEIKKKIAFIENEVVETSDVDITKGTEDRIKAYQERKKNKGMIGIPTGIRYLDYLTKGLINETLTTVIANTGVGKALTLDTPVLTRNGFIPMRDVKVGTEVFSRDGRYYPVSAIYPQGKKSVYRVSFEDGTYVDCCKEHLWMFKTSDDVTRNNGWRVDSLETIMTKHPIKRGRSYNINIPVTNAIRFDRTELPLDPYVLGALLGDGGFTTDRISFTTIDESLVEKLNRKLTDFNGKFTQNSGNPIQYHFLSNNVRENKLYRCIKSLGLQGTNSETKFIPSEYLTASIQDRLALVQGLVDTDGTVTSRGFVQYHTGSETLCKNFAYLVRSLGYRCRIKVYKRSEKNLPEYRVHVSAKTNELFSSQHRKEQFESRYRSNRPNYYKLLKVVSIEELNKEEEMQCITVDSPDHTFICGDFIVTHNTWLQILIGSNCMLQNYRVLQFVTEMSEEIMRDRYEAVLFSKCYTGMNYNAFKSGNLPLDVERQYFQFLSEDLPAFEPLIIATASGVMGVSAEIDKYDPDIILIDSAYLMEDDQGAKDDWLRVAHITRDLKKLAKRCKKPIVINTQADKNTSKKTGPELGSIMYTQAIGQDSDNVIALFRDEIMLNDREMGLKVLKQREGTLGKLTINWDFDTMNFSDIFMESNEESPVEESEGDAPKNTLDINELGGN